MDKHQPLLRRIFSGDLAIIFYLSILNLAIHLYPMITGGYGLFRDELYYLACAGHLDYGYVDQPPLSIYVLRIATALFGDSLFAVRLVPALCSAASVWLIGLITIRMGGGRAAVFIACLFGFGLAAFAMTGYYSMNAIEIVLWGLVFYTITFIIDEGKPVHWICLGVLLGIGLQNKIGMLFLGAGLFAGLLLTEQRRWLTTKWPYVAGAIAFLIFVPYIIWNFRHDWAHLEFIHNASSGKYSALNASEFLKGQVMMNNPVAILIWLPGLVALFALPRLRPFRILGWIYLTALIILLANKTSKDIYLLPAYTPLWAAGGVLVESVLHRWVVRFAVVALVLIWLSLTVLVLPVTLPILPVERLIAHTQQFGIQIASAENKELGDLHQFFADMFGWEEKVKAVAQVYHALPEADRAKCAIYASNYGRCAAVDYYGPAYGLPRSIGNHNAYFTWGPRDYTGDVMIIMGGRLEDHIDDFESVEQVAVSDCDHCMPYEDSLVIFLGRNLKADLRQVWPSEKHYD